MSWQWDFNGDGTIDATTSEPLFTYVATSDTSFDVQLIVSNGLSADTVRRSDYIVLTGPISQTTVNTELLDLGTIDVNTPRVDTTFTVYNNGSGMDSVHVSLDYGTITVDSALAVSPMAFAIGPRDSQVVTFTVFPPLVNKTIFGVYTPKILLESRFNRDVTVFAKSVQFRLEGTVTGAEEENGLPESYALDQNYPNPFNPATTIRYALPEQARVTLRVFTLLGEEIATLIDEVQEAGFRSVDFDASAFASGAYFYRLTAGSFVETRRMILVK
jgi:PKD repeat protein